MAMQRVFKPRVSDVAQLCLCLLQKLKLSFPTTYIVIKKILCKLKMKQNILSHGSLRIGLNVICQVWIWFKSLLHVSGPPHGTSVDILRKAKPIICIYNTYILFVFGKCFRTGSSFDNTQRQEILQFVSLRNLLIGNY